MLDESPAFQLQGALFNRPGENQQEDRAIRRRKKEFVGAGTAGRDWDASLVRTRKRHQHNVFAEGSNFLQHLQTVASTHTDAVEIKNHRPQFPIIDECLDRLLVFGLNHAEIFVQSAMDIRKHH
jgi:hypothetical protein